MADDVQHDPRQFEFADFAGCIARAFAWDVASVNAKEKVRRALRSAFARGASYGETAFA